MDKNKHQKNIFSQTILLFAAYRMAEMDVEAARKSFLDTPLAAKWGNEFTVADLWEISEGVYNLNLKQIELKIDKKELNNLINNPRGKLV